MGKKRKSNFSNQRIESEILEKIGFLLIKGSVKDPRVHDITLSGVEMSSDGAFAKVFYFIREDVIGQKDEIQEGLNHVSGFIRKQIAPTIRTRFIPQLQFVYDTSLDYGATIERALKEIHGSQRPEPQTDNGSDDM